MRDSVTQPGCWALSVRVPTYVNCVGITHYLIQRSKHGVKLKVCIRISILYYHSLVSIRLHSVIVPLSGDRKKPS